MRSRLALPLAIGLIAGTLLTGCSETVGEGAPITVNRDVATFDAAEVTNGIALQIKIGIPGQISIKAPANIVPFITTSVEGETLKVGASKSFIVTEPVEVSVSTLILGSVKATGGARVAVADLDLRSFAVNLDGGSVASARGSAANLTVKASGGSRGELTALAANAASVDISGGSNVALTVNGPVSGKASGGSRLDIGGAATVNVEATGGAQVVTH